MAVRPIDSLTMVPRLNEAGRLTHHQEQQPYAFQHVLGSQMQEKAQRERTRVKQKEKVEQAGVQRDKEKGAGDQGERPQGQRERVAQPQAQTGSRRQSGRLDVKC